MKKAMTTGVVVLALGLMLTVTAVAASPFGKATGGESNFTVGDDSAHRSFNAQGDASGAKGQVESRVIDPASGEVVRQFHGVVDCYYQDGNKARFSGQITNAQGGQDTEGRYFLWSVEDNGEGKKATGPDRFRAIRSVTPLDCQLTPLPATQEVTKGNIQVR
jgi:hypothetical protein